MSIEDRLQSAGNAWRESQPPVTVGMDVRRKSALWLPLTAAAAAVAVVVGASMLVSREETAPVAAGIVPWAELKFMEADVPAPHLPGLDSSPPQPGPCGADQVRGTVARSGSGSDITGRIELRAATACTIGSGDPVLRFTGPTDGIVGPTSRFVGHAAATTPPAKPVLLVSDESPVVVPFRWTGSNCVPADLLRVEGLDTQPGMYFVALDKATFAPCDEAAPTADGELIVGIPHRAGQPAARLPEGRDALRVSLELPSQLGTDDYRYVVALANPTPRDIPLAPCPTYAWTLVSEPRTPPGGYPTPGSGGGVISPGFGTAFGGGRLNCEAAPAAVAAGQTVRFEMRIPAELTQQDTATATITWAIAGPPAAVSDTPAPSSDSSEPVDPSPGPGTTTSLRADLDDDKLMDVVALVQDRFAHFTVDRARGIDPAPVGFGPGEQWTIRGVLPLDGPDGLLLEKEGGSGAIIYRVLQDDLALVADQGGAVFELAFGGAEPGPFQGVRCADGALQTWTARAIQRKDSTWTVETAIRELLLAGDRITVQPGQLRTAPSRVSRDVAITLARTDGATRCEGLDLSGFGGGVERSVTYAR